MTSGGGESALTWTAAEIAAAAQLACTLEVLAPKPGNVSPGRSFDDVTAVEFLASAAAIGDAVSQAGDRPLGASILAAVRATARWTRANTNLGIVLLLMPLARAMHLWRERPGGARHPAASDLRAALRAVLDATTVEDARDVYAAIRLAAPGGLGRAGEQDVRDEPTRPLLEVMRLAQERDDIAREYGTGYVVTFDIAVPAMQEARAAGLEWDDAIVETFLVVLAARADTHIVRRAGAGVAAEISRRAAEVLAAGGVRSEAGRRTIETFDRALRRPDNLTNPGTTADVTAAATFVVLVCGGWAPRRAATV